MLDNLKLYVWEDVLCDYTCGMMVALATDVDEARRLIQLKTDCIPEDDLAREPLEVIDPTAFISWGGG